MSKTVLRPRNVRCYGDNFVAAAGRDNEQAARRIWRRVMEHVKGARYSTEDAMTDYATHGQLQTLAAGDRRSQFPRMSEEDWELLKKVATKLTRDL